MNFKKITFQNMEGQQLSARLDLPVDGKADAFALFAHCFTCTKNLKAVGHICKALNREGIAVLRFDFTGLGESEGDFADTNFSSNVADLVAAARFLETNYQAPRILIGHSLGGAAVLQSAAQIPSTQAIATIGAPGDPSHVTHLLAPHQKEILEAGAAEVKLAGRAFRIKKQFLDDLAQNRMRETLASLKRALLVLHSPLDEVVGIDNAAQLFKAAKHPKSFVSLDQADHLLSRPEDSLYAGTIIAAWARKYIARTEEASQPLSSAANQVIARIGRKGYQTEVRMGAHGLLADEPVSVGGSDRGPTPYDLLQASLSACTAMTLRMYADRKGWPLQAVMVRSDHDKIHAENCRNCDPQKGMLDRIEREIELDGPLDAAQKERLLQIANRCPVHRTLNAEIVIDTRLVDKPDEQ